ncbi:MAG: TniQ family protein [Sphingopyxis sp.]|nr:TniQ family protein [Sphingopyxis sp.]
MADEPAHSVAARLAARHGEGMMRFLAGLGLDVRDLAVGREIDRLAAISSVDGHALSRTTANSSKFGRGICLGGENLSRVDWAISPRRICPACLADDRAASDDKAAAWAAWHRNWWDVRCIQLCPAHGCLLTCRCPECNSLLDWQTRSIDRCPHGHLLSVPGTESSLDATVDRYLQGRLLTSGSGPETLFLDQFAIGKVARIVERLGAIELDGWSHSFSVSSDEQLTARRRRAGFRMAANIGSRLPAALDDVIAHAAPGRRGLIASYGWIYRSWLGVPGADQSGGQLLFILLAHAVEKGLICEEERGASSRKVALKMACAAFGKGHASTRKIVMIADLVPSGSRPGVSFQIDAGEIERIRRHVAGLLDFQTAAKFLGIGRNQFRSLVRLELVSCDAEAATLGFGQLISPYDLEGFLNSLASDAPLVPHTPSGMVALPDACRAAGVSLADACQAILSGRIKTGARCNGAGGIAAVKLMVEDLLALRVRPRPIGMVSTALRIHPQAASALIKAGAFGKPPDISGSSLSAFGRRYVKPAELAKIWGGNGRAIVRSLAAADVPPAFGPPHCRQLFYPRERAMRLLTREISSHTIQ